MNKELEEFFLNILLYTKANSLFIFKLFYKELEEFFHLYFSP